MNRDKTRIRQNGVVLVVALILLLVLTLLGLTSMRTTTQEERMTSNTYDRSLAFQAAEAALRIGEEAAQAQSNTVPPNAGFDNSGNYTDAADSCSTSPCQNGLCSAPDKDCTVRWQDSAFNGWRKAYANTDSLKAALGTLAAKTTPQYFVEYLGGTFACNAENPTAGAQNCKRYRVTARSDDGQSGRAMVMLQSIYATE